ncbi:DUF5616 domain-containing protein [Methanocaldococcus sp. 10A]
MKEHEIILCDDNIYRDFENVYGKYKLSNFTNKSICLLLEILKQYDIKFVIYLDAQVSKSGELAKIIREKIKKKNLKGEVFCIKTCDYELKHKNIVATSDSAIIKSKDVKYVIDFIAEAINYQNNKK